MNFSSYCHYRFFPIILPNVNFLRFDYDDASIASPLYNVPLAYGKRFENCHNEGDLHANVPCRLILYEENEFLLSSFFDDKAKYSCLNNDGSIAETLTLYGTNPGQTHLIFQHFPQIIIVPSCFEPFPLHSNFNRHLVFE